MILNSIHLQNWQPFLGRGLNSTKVELESNSGHKNLIIYGENTHGKTAIWQAIQFGFFGKVNKRKTGWEDKKWKPWMADSTAQEPLLNQTANEKGDYTFGVILRFNHGGDDFTLERTVGPRRGVSKPRTDGDLQDEPLYIRNESKGTVVKEPQDFINDILPYDLAQFFMFDGERLDQYRKLFEDTKDVKLKSYIEAILRFPVLTDGSQDFSEIKKKEEKSLKKYKLRGIENEGLEKTIKTLENNLLQHNKYHEEEVEKKEGLIEDLGVVDEWLKQKDKGAEALAQQKIYGDQVEEFDKKIEQAQKRLSRSLPGSWRTILSSRVEARLNKLDLELVRQDEETKRIGEIDTEIGSLEARLKGEPCTLCGHIHNEPNPEEIDKINSDLVGLNSEKDKLEASRIDPDPHYLRTRQRALYQIKSDAKLDALIDAEEDIVVNKQGKRDANKLLERAIKLLSSEARREVQEYLANQSVLQDDIAVSKELIKATEAEQGKLETEIKRLMEQVQPKTVTIAHKKCEKRIKVLSSLVEVWEEVTDVHRETMRARVEENASEMFMSLTNKKKTYKGLKIHSDFQVEIIHKKKSRGAEAGSGGQSALVAYSILDALTKSSGIEFPMVVDTPARSIDETNLNRLFDYLFMESGKQVILLPESKELKPDDGDDRYGGACAATYDIELIGEDEDLSKLNIRINNTGKTNKELGYDD